MIDIGRCCKASAIFEPQHDLRGQKRKATAKDLSVREDALILGQGRPRVVKDFDLVVQVCDKAMRIR